MRKHFIAFYHCTIDKIAYVSVCPSNAKTLVHPENFNQLSFNSLCQVLFFFQYLSIRLSYSQTDAVQNVSSAVNIFCGPEIIISRQSCGVRLEMTGSGSDPREKKTGSGSNLREKKLDPDPTFEKKTESGTDPLKTIWIRPSDNNPDPVPEMDHT